jgi:multiple sugar transport system substrate-binding protein
MLGYRVDRAEARQPAASPISIPDSGAALPTDDFTFRILAQGPGPRTPFFESFVAAYQEAHPNITIQYEELPAAELQQAVPLAIQNGNAQDIFQLPPEVTHGQAVSEGWVAPLDDVIPNFDAWKDAFPPGVFVNGITVFDGKTYAFPLTSNKRYATLTLFNQQYLQEAGYDPSTTPLTWDTFREAARKVTEQGQGAYYGLMLAAKAAGNLASFVSNLAEMAGAAGGELNWQTGEYNYGSEQFLAATELLMALQSDGSIFPGALSLLEPEAIAQVPQGVAGMILQGPWSIPRWQANAPDFTFGVGSQPQPNDGTAQSLHHAPGGANHYWIYADSQYSTIAGDMFGYIGSLEGQTAYSALTDGSIPPILAEATQTRELDAPTRKALELFDQQMRLAPDPRVRNPEVGNVDQELQRLTPTFGETIQGIFTGQLSDAKAALLDLQDRANAELERAIEAARANGAEVTRDDWVFANWDPEQDYTEEMYQAL